MKFFPKARKTLLPFVQWVVYRIIWTIGLAFAVIAGLMGLGALFMNETGREIVRQHWLLSLAIFLAVNTVAIAFTFLKWHLERRWPHVIY